MLYCNATETKTDMTPSVPVERESIKMQMEQTYQLLDSAVATADAILNSIRTPIPRKDEEPPHVACMMDAALENRATAARLCDILKEIGLQLGVGM